MGIFVKSLPVSIKNPTLWFGLAGVVGKYRGRRHMKIIKNPAK